MSKSRFTIYLEPKAIEDIQSAIDFYDKLQLGLARKFEKELNVYLGSLEKAPFYSIRYDDVHCVPMRKFPFIIHYTIDDTFKQIVIRAVFHTSLNPEKWKV
jgi:hypothetical protein